MGKKSGHPSRTPQLTNAATAEARELLDELPGDCTMEDIQYHLYRA